MNKHTDSVVNFRGVQLRRREKIGPKGGEVLLWQAAESDPVWGYWYSTATEAARLSNVSDRVIRA